MKILITGSNGLLGQKLVKLLLEEGVEVIATARGTNRLPYTHPNLHFVSLDITNSESINNVFGAQKPDVVINTAAMTNVDQSELEREACVELNVTAVKYLVAACEENDIFLVHLSTDFIFKGDAGPYGEDDESNPVNFYGQSKLDGEKVLMASKIDWAIVRTVLVYGIVHDMSRSNIALWVKSSLESGKQIKVVDDQLRSPTLADDLAIGCYLIAKKKAKGVFNIAGKDLLTPYQMAEKTAAFFNLDTSTMERADSSTFQQTAQRPLITGLLIEKARRELGYEPRSFDEGLALMAAEIERMGH